eukprot:TRINITY_DN5854_c0_g1_i2.p1 TRINITY_DN5854_c0_g1~~TRINITY_DN5854_c0_g1_i2.p1  ORF type:complete len:179 (-),score=23.50 TRINITY_DN5854_c0_g1_i2:62-598(-)
MSCPFSGLSSVGGTCPVSRKSAPSSGGGCVVSDTGGLNLTIVVPWGDTAIPIKNIPVFVDVATVITCTLANSKVKALSDEARNADPAEFELFKGDILMDSSSNLEDCAVCHGDTLVMRKLGDSTPLPTTFNPLPTADSSLSASAQCPFPHQQFTGKSGSVLVAALLAAAVILPTWLLF